MIKIDSREPQFIKDSIKDAEIIRLDVGDYIIQDLLIERKSPTDFILSILDKRLFRQMQAMKENDNYIPLISITGNIWRGLADRKIENGSSMIFGTLKTIIKDFKIPVIQFDNEKDFISFLKIADKPKDNFKNYLPLPKRRAVSAADKKSMSLTYIDGISIKTARQLLKEFSSIKNIAGSSKKDFISMNGIGKKLADNIYGFFN